MVVELVVDDVVVELVDGVGADDVGGLVVVGADGVDVVGATLVVVLVVGAGGMSSLSGWVLGVGGSVVGLPVLLLLLLSGGSSALSFGACVVCGAGSASPLMVGESEF